MRFCSNNADDELHILCSVTQPPVDNLIEALSAQPVMPSDWLQRLQAASRLIFGGGSLALVARRDPQTVWLSGLIDLHGQVLVQAPPALQDCGRTDIVLALPEAQNPGVVPIDADHNAGLASASSALHIPWPLGISNKLAFLSMPLAGANLEAVQADKLWSFLIVANNLVRRTEKHALVDASAWIEDEIRKLAVLQELLKPVDLDEFAGVDFAIHSRPHAYAGGDYYDIWSDECRGADGTNVGCAFGVADVSGHGPSAVVETAMIDSILRTYSDITGDAGSAGPASLLDYLNRHMFTRRSRPSFATVFLAMWTPGERSLRYACAGHPPPLIKRADSGDCVVLETGSDIPVQVLRDYTWTERHMALAAGDVLVVYTDGITEALSPGGVQFCERRLIEAVNRAAPERQAVIAAVNEALKRHVNGRPFHDDQTLIVARFI